MSIYYPSFDSNKNGQTPLYIKIIPRGDVSTVSSELSSLELLSVSKSTFFSHYNQLTHFKISIQDVQFK